MLEGETKRMTSFIDVGLYDFALKESRILWFQIESKAKNALLLRLYRNDSITVFYAGNLLPMYAKGLQAYSAV